jgi:hypothetical protein
MTSIEPTTAPSDHVDNLGPAGAERTTSDFAVSPARQLAGLSQSGSRHRQSPPSTSPNRGSRDGRLWPPPPSCQLSAPPGTVRLIARRQRRRSGSAKGGLAKAQRYPRNWAPALRLQPARPSLAATPSPRLHQRLPAIRRLVHPVLHPIFDAGFGSGQRRSDPRYRRTDPPQLPGCFRPQHLVHSRPAPLTTLGIIGLVLVLSGAIAIARSLQTMYGKVFGHVLTGWPARMREGQWLVGAAGFFCMQVLIGRRVEQFDGRIPAESIQFLLAIVFWWWSLHCLLTGRVPWPKRFRAGWPRPSATRASTCTSPSSPPRRSCPTRPPTAPSAPS